MDMLIYISWLPFALGKSKTLSNRLLTCVLKNDKTQKQNSFISVLLITQQEVKQQFQFNFSLLYSK